MSGGGGGSGGPTVSHEPGVRNEPLLIAAVVVSCSMTSLASGQQTVRSSISSSKTDNGAFPLVEDGSAVGDEHDCSVRDETDGDRRSA